MPRELESTIKVLVVDDSAFMRKVIADILNSDDEIEVIDTARNGQEAIEKIIALKPDVITLDIEMPVMDGLTCLRELVKVSNAPAVMLSSLTQSGTEATIRALEYGAVDFVAKPTNIFNITDEDKKRELIEKVKLATKYKKGEVVQRELPEWQKVKPKKEFIADLNIKKVVAIGVSTGGPKALRDVIPLIPAGAPAAFLVVQHMPPGFTKSLAERLNSMSEVLVKEAEDGEIIKAGCVYFAPGDYHMKVDSSEGNNLMIKLSKDPPVGGHRPAVNVTLDSLSKTGLNNIIAVIMTGMGGDGSEGIKKIKNINKGYIIAQDEKTCVVYGMPKVAVETGVVDAVVPLTEITKEIMRIVGV